MRRYLTVGELIERLQKIDKRKYIHTPYVSSLHSYRDGEYTLTLVTDMDGGRVKDIYIKTRKENQ